MPGDRTRQAGMLGVEGPGRHGYTGESRGEVRKSLRWAREHVEVLGETDAGMPRKIPAEPDGKISKDSRG